MSYTALDKKAREITDVMSGAEKLQKEAEILVVPDNNKVI